MCVKVAWGRRVCGCVGVLGAGALGLSVIQAARKGVPRLSGGEGEVPVRGTFYAAGGREVGGGPGVAGVSVAVVMKLRHPASRVASVGRAPRRGARGPGGGGSIQPA